MIKVSSLGVQCTRQYNSLDFINCRRWCSIDVVEMWDTLSKITPSLNDIEEFIPDDYLDKSFLDESVTTATATVQKTATNESDRRAFSPLNFRIPLNRSNFPFFILFFCF